MVPIEFLRPTPGSRTGIKIEYPGAAYDLIDADDSIIEQTLQRCIPHKELRAAQAAWDSTHPAMRELTYAHYLNDHCHVSAASCKRDPHELECQEFLRQNRDKYAALEPQRISRCWPNSDAARWVQLFIQGQCLYDPMA